MELPRVILRHFLHCICIYSNLGTYTLTVGEGITLCFYYPKSKDTAHPKSHLIG